VPGFGNGGVAGAGTAGVQGRMNCVCIGLSFGGRISGAALDSNIAGVAGCDGPGGRLNAGAGWGVGTWCGDKVTLEML
jgi:hypothetical protein